MTFLHQVYIETKHNSIPRSRHEICGGFFVLYHYTPNCHNTQVHNVRSKVKERMSECTNIISKNHKISTLDKLKQKFIPIFQSYLPYALIFDKF